MSPTKHDSSGNAPNSTEAPTAKAGGARAERLAAALRDNLKRRKAQSRARQQEPGTKPAGGTEAE